MPKVKGPLFSVDAHGALGKALTYQGRPGGSSVYGYKKPKVPLTYLQVQQRGLIAAATAYWQSLSDADKAIWELKAKGQGQSGYSYMIKQYVGENYDRPLWLPMNEGTGVVTADRSGHGNDGDIIGASWVAGKYGYALSFDGIDNYVDCGSDPSLFPVEAITWQCSIRPIALNGNQYLMSSDANGQVNLHLDANHKIKADLFTATGWMGALSTTVLVNDTRYRVGLTYDSLVLRLFINGVEEATDDTNPGSVVYQAVKQLTLGRRMHLVTPEWFAGPIDWVSINNRAVPYARIWQGFMREKHLYGV